MLFRSEKFQTFIVDGEACRGVGEGFVDEGQGARFIRAVGRVQAQRLAEVAQLIVAGWCGGGGRIDGHSSVQGEVRKGVGRDKRVKAGHKPGSVLPPKGGG